MPVEFIDLSKISVDDRARREFLPEKLTSLMESLQRPVGLLNAISVLPADADGKYALKAGERRLRATTSLAKLEQTINYNGSPVPLGMIPVNILAQAQELKTQLQVELDENVEREDFTVLEKMQLQARITELAQRIVDSDSGKPEKPKKAALSLGDISPEAMKAATEKLNDGKSGGSYTAKTRMAVRAADEVRERPDSPLAKKLSKAKTENDVRKALQQEDKEILQKRLAAVQGDTFSSKMHKLHHGDCLEILPTLERNYFDVCITDPLYGIDAGKRFGNSAGRASAFSHDYDDSYETWQTVMPEALKILSRLMKKNAHIYLACDIDRYHELKQFVSDNGIANNPWKIQRAPIIQYKKAGGRVPQPGYSFRRSYELWLYAFRGDKQEHKMLNDVIETVSGGTEIHGAGKPVALLKTFLERSCLPGEKCIDFMAGSGSIIPACHEAKVECTAVEINKTYYGRCLERQKELGKLKE